MSEEHDQALKSLLRIKSFDPNELVQNKKLGENDFKDAVEPAKRVISLCQRIPDSIVSDLSKGSARALKRSADVTFSRFEEILQFDLEEGAVKSRRDSLIAALEAGYDSAFDELLPIISFSIADTSDFPQLEARGRAAIQAISDETKEIREEISTTLNSANELLEEVRNVAAEEGVLKQAKFFKEEAENHVISANKWLVAAAVSVLILLVYTVAMLLLAQEPFFQNATTYGFLQIAISKVLIFSVLTYAVIACVKNYRSHRHNAVVNKHRQNALMTYRTLSEAGASPEARDTILNHAAAAIYSPVDSGYVSNEERGYGTSLPAISLTPRASVPSLGE